VPDAELPAYPRARRPDRHRVVESDGLRLAVWEWGDEDAPPLLLAHGGFDFAGTFDVFAPLLAAGGWRVVSWDQRGHGESDHAVLYGWDADLRDALRIVDTVTNAAIPMVGHSKGASLVVQLAEALPFRCSHVVNMEGLPSRRAWPELAEHDIPRFLGEEVRGWLDHRARAAGKLRRADTLEGLAERRRQQNPRLDPAWLRYLVGVGGRQDADGWRWKLDPSLRFGRFGPWRPEWALERLAYLRMPVLGVLGGQDEPMSWGTRPEDVLPYLPPGGRLEVFDDAGHFVHIERPDAVAGLVLEFLGPPGGGSPAVAVAGAPAESDSVGLVHSLAKLQLHRLAAGADASCHPLLLLHGLGERSPDHVPGGLERWPGPVYALDFTGHGGSTRPTGGGYTAELLMADADTALRHLGEATVHGRGLGAYIALLIAGARPDLVRGAILADGPGMIGGGPGPMSSLVHAFSTPPAARSAPERVENHCAPDPYALVEMSRDPRPPDYAAAITAVALHGTSLATPIAVVAVTRPAWLEAILLEPGVETMTLDEALRLYSMPS
jgi:pimeloyl-ACP methyl ester carboxylesterase